VRRETGNEQSVQVRCDEGVAIHIGPEPCVAIRKDGGEASVGECIGQPFSLVRFIPWAPTPLRRRRATRTGTQRERPDGLAWSKNLACAEARYAGTGRSHA